MNNMKVKKSVAVVLAAVIMLSGTVIFAGAITLGASTVRYMTQQNFSFETALQWSWEDLTTGFDEILGNTKTDIVEFGPTNEHIDVVACTAL